jgi:nicotinate phosphoribosyltransferase
MAKSQSALLTDLYQLNMMVAYLDHGITGTAVFELFVALPPVRATARRFPLGSDRALAA